MDIEYIGRVLSRLKPFVQNGVLRRTRLERVLGTLQVPATSVRPDVERLLAKVGIAIDEDIALRSSLPAGATDAPEASTEDDLGPAKAAEHRPVADRGPVDLGRALAAARRRLDLDRSTRKPAKILLTAQEEVGLALLVRGERGHPLAAGDFARLSGEGRRAAESLFMHNQGLIHSVARRTPLGTLEYDDLVQHGVIGLIRAIELFDPSVGTRFSTYAVNWIRQSITRGLANESRLIRLPVHMIERVNKVWATRMRLTVDGEPPSVQELARHCDLSDDQVRECLRLGPEQTVSLDLRIGDSETTLGDLLDLEDYSERVHDIVAFALLQEQLHQVLDTLSEREAGVISMRFGLVDGEPRTLEEIGTVYGVTRERIRQIETKTISKLRHPSRSDALRSYMFDGEAEVPKSASRDSDASAEELFE